MINDLRIKIAEFLGIPIIDSKFLFIDSWTFLHFFAGMLIMFLIFRYARMDTKRKFAFLFILIGVWEIFELESPLIAPEKTVDIIYDFIVGMAGGTSYYYSKVF